MNRYSKWLQLMWLVSLSVIAGALFACASALITWTVRGDLPKNDLQMTYWRVSTQIRPIPVIFKGYIYQRYT